MRPSVKALLRGAALSGALLFATPAWAITCGEILSMVGYNIPTHIIVQTMEGSGTQFTSEDVACLRDGEAPSEVIASARAVAEVAEREEAARRRPARERQPEPEPEPTRDDPLPAFDDLGSTPDPRTEEDLLAEASGPPRLQELIRAYRSRRLLTASHGLHDLLAEGIYPEEHDKIQYYLAKSLYDLGMYHGAQHYFLQVIRSGPSSAYFKYALPNLVAVADLTGNDIELLRFVHRVPPEAFPRGAQSHLYYLMGRRLYEAEELSASARYFQQVSPRSEHFMRAKYFEGVIHNQRGQLRSAVTAFRDVYQAEVEIHDARTREEISDLRELALIDIARIYYGLERFENADQFYSQVDRSSSYWPTSLFERAWSTFMQNDLNLTLGLLLTANSPQFDQTEFLPEASILRGLTYFQLCDYPEVQRLLLDFEGTYRPLQAELRAFLDRYATAEGRELADQAFDAYFRDPHAGSDLQQALFLKVLRHRDLAALVRHIDMMDDEVARIDNQRTIWRDGVGATVKEQIERDRLRYKRRAGQILLQQLAQEYEYVSDLLTQSEIIRFEVVDAQRVDYEYRATNPLVETGGDRVVDFSTSKTVIYWPFNGEFWNDELGHYRYTEAPSCQ